MTALNTQRKFFLVALGSFIAGLLLAAVGIGVFHVGSQATSPKALRESDIPTAQSEYKFIDPLIGLKGTLNTAKYTVMQQRVVSFISDQQNNDLITATVYFRDIHESGGFDTNPSELFTPASLNKVPVMMAYYKIAESDASILSDMLTYTGTKNSNAIEDIKSAVQLTPGASYSVSQLIEHMIRYSDNNAADLLTQHLSDTNHLSDYEGVFNDLGVNSDAIRLFSDTITAQQYAIFLRALYNATYLDRTDSERAMKLLSETDFSEGIESGVPNDIPVAQKFGEVRLIDTKGTVLGKELNNCGIIYYPGHPYLLCIMLKGKGNDVKSLETQAAALSRIIFEQVEILYPR